MDTPLEHLGFPIRCTYAGCDAGPFTSAEQVDEHVSEDHLVDAVWLFVEEFMRSECE